MRGSYPDTWFLSRCVVPIQNEGRWIDTTHRRATHATTSILNTSPAHRQPIRMHGCAITICRKWRPHTPLFWAAGTQASVTCPPHGTPPSSVHPAHCARPSRTVLLRCEATNHALHAPDTAHAWSRTRAPRAAAPGPHHPRIQNAYTKRARTNRSGRATYSAQALGRLPWFAPFLRRSRRLRPRFDMSFSLGLLSRLKHFCTHRPKPPRHRPFAATKVTEKRVAHRASSMHESMRELARERTPTTRPSG